MKNKILLWTLLLLASFSSSFAGASTGVNDRIANNFRKDFATASDVQWEKGSNYVKATFKMSEQVLFAYYSEEGELLAVTRNLSSSQLPIGLLTQLKKSYTQYWISDLFEMARGNETAYYITLESGDQTLILRSNGSNNWEVYKKEKKDVQ